MPRERGKCCPGICYVVLAVLRVEPISIDKLARIVGFCGFAISACLVNEADAVLESATWF